MPASRTTFRSICLVALMTGVTLLFSVWSSFEPVRAMRISGDSAGSSATPRGAAEDPVDEEATADLQIRLFGPLNGEVAAGADLSYTIVIDNLGPDEAANVVLRDLVNSDGAFDLVSISSDRSAVCNPAPGAFSYQLDLTCTLDQPLEALSAQASGRWLVTVVLRAAERQGINALAAVRSDTLDPDAANNEATATYKITERADLAITMGASGENLTAACPPEAAWLADEVNAGGRMQYDLSVANAGPSTATYVVVKQQLPDGMQFSGVEASSGGCNVDVAQKMITCGLGTIEASSAVTIAVDGLANGGLENGQLLINNALVTAATYDENNGNDIANNVTTVHKTTDLSVTMAAAGDVVSGWDSDSETAIVQRVADQVSAGSRLQYTYTIHNGGLSAAADVQLQGHLPFKADQVSGARCVQAENDPGLTLCTAATIPAGGDQIVVLSGLTDSKLADGELIKQMSSVSSGISDVCAENDSATNITAANTVADYALDVQPAGAAKTNGIDQGLVEVTPGSQHRYTLTVSNGGPSDGDGPRVAARLFTFDNGALGEKFVACEPIAPLTGVTCVFEEPDVVRVTSMVSGEKIIIAPAGAGTLGAHAAYRFDLLTEVARDFLEQDKNGSLSLSAELKGATTDYRPANNAAAAEVHVVQGEVNFMLPLIVGQ